MHSPPRVTNSCLILGRRLFNNLSHDPEPESHRQRENILSFNRSVFTARLLFCRVFLLFCPPCGLVVYRGITITATTDKMGPEIPHGHRIRVKGCWGFLRIFIERVSG